MVQRDSPSLGSLPLFFNPFVSSYAMSPSDESYPDLSLISAEEPIVRRTPTTVLLSFINEITDSGAVRDGLKLIVVGGILEASRRGLGLLLRQAYYCELVLSIPDCR